MQVYSPGLKCVNTYSAPVRSILSLADIHTRRQKHQDLQLLGKIQLPVDGKTGCTGAVDDLANLVAAIGKGYA